VIYQVGTQEDINNTDNSKENKFVLQLAMLCEKPDVIFSTPTRLLIHIQQKTLVLKHSIDTLVVDEAALVLSFGYSSEDLSEIFTVGHTVSQT